LQKLAAANEKFHFKMGNSHPQRGHQIFELLPSVAKSVEYVPGLAYETIKKYGAQRDCRYWHEMTERDFLLEINTHLEKGRRIEDFLPDLEIVWQPPWVTTEVCDDLPESEIYIGIYCAAYSIQRLWGFWDEKGWFELINMIHKERPNAMFVMIGAQWDAPLAAKVMELMKDNNIPHHNTVGLNLGYVLQLLRRLNYFIAFPSGLPILNESLGKNTFMFYPTSLINMMEAWAKPERIANYNYIAQLFCTPAEAYERITKRYNLFDKI
jgi:hypothetical protein